MLYTIGFVTRQNFYYIKSHFIVSIFKNPVLKNLLIVSVLSDQNLILTLQNLVFTTFLELYLIFFSLILCLLSITFHTNVIEIATSMNTYVGACGRKVHVHLTPSHWQPRVCTDTHTHIITHCHRHTIDEPNHRMT